MRALTTLSYAVTRICESLSCWPEECEKLQRTVDDVVQVVARLDAGENEEADVEGTNITEENLVERLRDIVRRVGSHQRVRELEMAVEQLSEEAQLVRETSLVERSRYEKAIEDLENKLKEVIVERDTSNSAAAVARALLRRQGVQMESNDSGRGRNQSPGRRPGYERPTFSAEEKHIPAWRTTPIESNSPTRSRGASPRHPFRREESRGGISNVSSVPRSSHTSQRDDSLRHHADLLQKEIRESRLLPERLPKRSPTRQQQPPAKRSLSRKASPQKSSAVKALPRPASTSRSVPIDSKNVSKARNQWVEVSPPRSTSRTRQQHSLVQRATTPVTVLPVPATTVPARATSSKKPAERPSKFVGSRPVSRDTAKMLEEVVANRR